jgi:hypothetical protein
MSKSIYKNIVDKSVKSAVSAIELYNKPNLEYREELFCIAIINSYELLFKAKILKDNHGKLNSIYVYEYKKLNNGKISKQRVIKKNRTGNPMTISLYECMNILKTNFILQNQLIENLNILIELRDNSIHFINRNNNLEEKLFEVCVATIKNYSNLVEEWFGNNILSDYNFNIMPLNFKLHNIESYNINSKQCIDNFLQYIDILSNINNEEDSRYYTILKIETKFTRVSGNEDLLIRYANEGKKITMELSEEIFLKMFPYEYKEIIQKIRDKINDIKINKVAISIIKQLQKDEKFCKPWYANIKKKTYPKFMYNANFVDYFISLYENIS